MTKKKSHKKYHKRRPKKKTKPTGVAGYGLIFMIVAAMFLAVGAIKYVSSPIFNTYQEADVNKEHQDFINKILPEALEVQKKYNILTSITLSQSILESNWGQSELSSKYNNLFGVKASEVQKGVNLSTTEYRSGVPETVTGRFRVYDSWDESIEAHAILIAHGTDWNSQQYKEVIEADNYRDSAKGLSIDGYATDPAYAEKIIEIIEKYHLNKYDQKNN